MIYLTLFEESQVYSFVRTYNPLLGQLRLEPNNDGVIKSHSTVKRGLALYRHYNPCCYGNIAMDVPRLNVSS